jgi:hypothetical protein
MRCPTPPQKIRDRIGLALLLHIGKDENGNGVWCARQ